MRVGLVIIFIKPIFSKCLAGLLEVEKAWAVSIGWRVNWM